MAYRAATYGFRNQGLTEMISLALASSEHSHAPKPSGSPIKVMNIIQDFPLTFNMMPLQFKLSLNEVLRVPLCMK